MPDKFLVVKKGYSIEAVDAYVTNVEKELSSYRKRESAISSAIVSAEESAAQILKNAETEAKAILDDIDGRLDEVKKMIEGENKALDEFCSEYDKVLRNYFSSKADDLAAPIREKLNTLSAFLDEKKAEGKGEESKEASDASPPAPTTQEDAENIIHNGEVKEEGGEDPFGVIKNYF